MASSATTPPNPDGTWQVLLSVPATAAAGKYGVYSTCDSYNTELYYPAVTLTVTTGSAGPWAIQPAANEQEPTGALNAVACGGPGSCVAVGDYTSSTGTSDTLSETWNGAAWSIVKPPDPGGGTGYTLNAVSCPSTTSCTTVGSYVDSKGHQVPLAETWNGAKWTSTSAAVPTGGSTDTLSGVSCPSTSYCVATGSDYAYVNKQFEQVGLSETWNGTTWTVQPVPGPSGSRETTVLSSVSCTSSSACTAVGWYVGPSYSNTPLAETWNGMAWTVSPITPPSINSTQLTSVSCTSPTACTAVGWYYDQNYSQDLLAEKWNGSSWTMSTPTLPPNSYSPSFEGVSCVSATSCTAVGNYYSSLTGTETPLAEQWNGGAWTVQNPVDPATASTASLTSVSCLGTTCESTGLYSTAKGTIPLVEASSSGSWTQQTTPSIHGPAENNALSVACPGAGACHAVGNYVAGGGSEPLAETWNGSAWSLDKVPSPKYSTNVALRSVSCPTASACEAVGYYDDNWALAEGWNGTAWAIQAVPKPSGAVSTALGSVACVAPNSCTAVGSYLSSSYQTHLIAATWNGTSWKLTVLPSISGFQGGGFTSIACPTSSSCTAVGWYYDQSYNNLLLVGTWNGTSWTVGTIGNLPPSYYPGLNSVSCVAANACTAVGQYYDSYGQEPLAEHWDGTTWTAQFPPGGGKGGSLAAVSCVSASSCTAVGLASRYGYPSQVPLAETWDGTTWMAQATPTVAGSLVGVSCVSAGACAAVGSTGTAASTVLTEGEGGA